MVNLYEASRQQRMTRRPQHNFQLRHVPYQIQPFLLAPVLPGETMKNLLMQARVVTDPVLSPLTGWWLEYYFFYVKLRDLANRDQLTEMLLDPSWTGLTGIDEAANYKHYHGSLGLNYAGMCLDRVVEEYFRNEGETSTQFALDGLPAASFIGNAWYDSLIQNTDYAALDVTVDVDATPVPDKVSIADIERGMALYQLARDNNLTTQTYEEFVRDYGVKIAQEEPHRPELVRFVREWAYPSNTINASTGAPTSAVSWSIAERADKARLFKEHGFLFGVTVARPKVYFSKQTGAAAWLLRDAKTWLPPTLWHDQGVSLTKVAQGVGPLALDDDTGGYWVDTRDLFMHGDQFMNFDPASAPSGFPVVPYPAEDDAQRVYPEALADITALFVTPASAYYCRQDGVVHLQIASNVRDLSPTKGTQASINL